MSCTKPEAIARVWALYGIELQGSAGVAELCDKIAALPSTDFGLTNVEDMESLLSLVQSLAESGRRRRKCELEASKIVDVVKAIDALIVKNGGTPPNRGDKQPRNARLAWAWRQLKGIPHPVTEVTTTEDEGEDV